MTRKFLNNKFALSKCYCRDVSTKNSILDDFPPPPPPLQNREFYFYCRLAVSEYFCSSWAQDWALSNCCHYLDTNHVTKTHFPPCLSNLSSLSLQPACSRCPRGRGYRCALDVGQHRGPILEGSCGPFLYPFRGDQKQPKLQDTCADITIFLGSLMAKHEFVAKRPNNGEALCRLRR